MRGGLEARGFQEVPWEDANLYPDGGFQTGDVVLSVASEGGKKHVVIITDAANDLLSEAWIAEDGSDDGILGDQTGVETRTVPYSSHPYTSSGAWTSCHRFNSDRFLAQWPEFAKTTSTPKPTLATPSAPAHAHGIDVSSYQEEANIAGMWADFIIVKCTEGDGYTNPCMGAQAQATLSSGKRLGLYHFARPGDVSDQVRYFLAAAKPYLGRATLWLDWEDDAPAQGPQWALAWLDAVAAATGTTPGIYMNDSVLSGYDWAAVAARYPLWYADPTNYNTTYIGYIDPAVPSLRFWGQPLVHQYSQRGRLAGYGGALDFNRLRDRATWDRMVGGGHVNAPSASAAQASPYTGKWNRSDGQGELVCNGVFGPATIGRLQQVMGTPVDGALDDDGSPAIERLQAFLNSAVPADTQVALNDAPALDVDGVLGPDTWRTLQYLIIAWHKEYLPDGWDYAHWVDGEAGPATIGALQRALNNSRSGSGRLW
jgi:GH25 family lysozyme M1 (1,4-beta-N-acetylmuramidase)